MLLALQLGCAFLLGMGVLFTWIDLRTRYGPMFRNFSVCLLVFPAVAMMDLFSYADYVSPSASLFLQRSMHMLVLVFIPFSATYLLKMAGREPGKIPGVFILGSLYVAPFVFTDRFQRLEGKEVQGGPWYVWTFFLLAACYLLFAYVVLILHLATAANGDRKFPALHLIAYLCSTAGGIADMIAVMRPELQVFPSCKSIGILAFGCFCAYFFIDRFLALLRERDSLFRQVEDLDREYRISQPIRKLGESAAFISHEIKNYVSILRSNQVLLRGKLEDGGGQEMDRIGRNTERLESFARSLLDYSNCTSPHRLSPMDLAGLTRDVIARNFPAHAAQIEILAPEECPAIRGDAALLERALLNLIKNGLEAEASRIRIEIRAPEGEIRLDIEDDGRGCASQDLAKLGTPFFTTKKASGGSGLGLALTASVVVGHGGRLEALPGAANSWGGRGVRIACAFPAVQPNPERSAEANFPWQASTARDATG